MGGGKGQAALRENTSARPVTGSYGARGVALLPGNGRNTLKRLTKLKKSLLKKKALALCALTAGAMLLGSGAAYAADVYGAGTDSGKGTSDIKDGAAVLVQAADGTYVTQYEGKAATSGSSFEIKGGTWDNVYGGYSKAEASTELINNTVTMTGGSAYELYGAYIIDGFSGVNISGNSVRITTFEAKDPASIYQAHGAKWFSSDTEKNNSRCQPERE